MSALLPQPRLTLLFGLLCWVVVAVVWWLQMLRSTIAYAQHERLMRDTGLQSKGIPLHRHSQRFKYVPRCVHNLTVARTVPFLTAFPINYSCVTVPWLSR